MYESFQCNELEYKWLYKFYTLILWVNHNLNIQVIENRHHLFWVFGIDFTKGLVDEDESEGGIAFHNLQ